ncbi:hypothetical protein VTN49DRAFT_7836 [Thermomyces lanuginosus]|uniref:uncharacterized protein n=1 Tax=Thermomyces lanuginosus TaxID=5541 RepID=UPI0037427FE5
MTQCGARALSRSANEALSKSTRRRSNHGSPVEEVKNQNPNGWSLAWAALSSVLTTQSANVVTPRAAARALPAVFKQFPYQCNYWPYPGGRFPARRCW